MGFFDRFKKDASQPDAYTREVAIRVRAVPGVERVEPVDADLLSVRWAGNDEPVELSIAEHRERWQTATGFDRIEVVDDLIDRVQPPAEGTFDPDAVLESAPVDPEPAAAPDVSDSAWSDVAPRLLPMLRRPVADDPVVAWPVAGLLEAVATERGQAVTLAGSEGWGVDAEEVRRTATSNLIAHEPALDTVAPDTRAWVPTAPAGAQAGWLTAPDALLAASGLDVAIVFVPTPTDLVVVDPADVDLLASITTSTLAIVEQEPTTICSVPFEIGPGRAEPWRPDPDHPCAALVDRAHAAFRER